MDGLRVLRNTQVIILGLCIAGATVVASIILSQAFLRFQKARNEVITVTGAATRLIKSDNVSWTASLTARDLELPKAYQQLNADLAKLRQYLLGKGIAETELTVPQVSIERVYKKAENGQDTHEFVEFRLHQNVEVNSTNVEKVTAVSRSVTELIPQGVPVQSGGPQYTFSGLDGLKLEMLARATENAKQRAGNMAQASGNRIGPIRSARMGVFQITPVTSTEVSDYGVNDTSSLDKKVTAVVNATFAIE
jgi:hypothetical protein